MTRQRGKIGHGSRKMSPQRISKMKYMRKKAPLNISLVGSVPEQEGYMSGIFLTVPLYYSASI